MVWAEQAAEDASGCYTFRGSLPIFIWQYKLSFKRQAKTHLVEVAKSNGTDAEGCVLQKSSSRLLLGISRQGLTWGSSGSVHKRSA